MKYIAKVKGANRFKTYDSITEFDVSDFDKYELYEVRAVNKEQYGAALRQQKIDELKEQLSELGVDLNAVLQPQAPQASVPATGGEPTSESPLLEGDKISGGDLTSKLKRKDGSLISMEEISDSFYKLTPLLEKDFPDLMYGKFDEHGITLMMTEIQQGIPKMLPNGIPVRQALG